MVEGRLEEARGLLARAKACPAALTPQDRSLARLVDTELAARHPAKASRR